MEPMMLMIFHNNTLQELLEELREKIDLIAGKDGSGDDNAVLVEGCAYCCNPIHQEICLKKLGSEGRRMGM
jgi:hypothetical protein